MRRTRQLLLRCDWPPVFSAKSAMLQHQRAHGNGVGRLCEQVSRVLDAAVLSRVGKKFSLGEREEGPQKQTEKYSASFPLPCTASMSEKATATTENWLRISLFCERCQTDAQIVTFAVTPDKTIGLRCICPHCGSRFQDNFTMEQLMSLGESSDHDFNAKQFRGKVIVRLT